MLFILWIFVFSDFIFYLKIFLFYDAFVKIVLLCNCNLTLCSSLVDYRVYHYKTATRWQAQIANIDVIVLV